MSTQIGKLFMREFRLHWDHIYQYDTDLREEQDFGLNYALLAGISTQICIILNSKQTTLDCGKEETAIQELLTERLQARAIVSNDSCITKEQSELRLTPEALYCSLCNWVTSDNSEIMIIIGEHISNDSVAKALLEFYHIKATGDRCLRLLHNISRALMPILCIKDDILHELQDIIEECAAVSCIVEPSKLPEQQTTLTYA